MTGSNVTPDAGRVERTHWALVLGLAAAAWVVGWPGPGGVLVGGAVVGLSLRLSSIGLRMLLGSARPRLAFGILFVKLLALFGLTWVAFAAVRQGPDPIGFALGVSCLAVAGVVEALRVRERG